MKNAKVVANLLGVLVAGGVGTSEVRAREIQGVRQEVCADDRQAAVIESVRSLAERLAGVERATLCAAGLKAEPWGGWSCKQGTKRQECSNGKPWVCNSQVECVVDDGLSASLDSKPVAVTPVAVTVEPVKSPVPVAAEAIPPAKAPSPGALQTVVEAKVSRAPASIEVALDSKLDSEIEQTPYCTPFASKLQACESYSCPFDTPIAGKGRFAIGTQNDKGCLFGFMIESNQTALECTVPKDKMAPFVGYYTQILNAKKLGKKGAEIYADGKRVENPIPSAISSGQCVAVSTQPAAGTSK